MAIYDVDISPFAKKQLAKVHYYIVDNGDVQAKSFDESGEITTDIARY